jgi:serine/threonine protein kinase
MPLAPGTKLGSHEILSALGAGGMGEVCRARDTRPDRSVAIKILPAHLSADPARKLRLAPRLDDVDPRVAFVLLINATKHHQYLGL